MYINSVTAERTSPVAILPTVRLKPDALSSPVCVLMSTTNVVTPRVAEHVVSCGIVRLQSADRRVVTVQQTELGTPAQSHCTALGILYTATMPSHVTAH